MENRRQLEVRIAQPFEQGEHGFEAQPTVWNRQRPQPVELRLNSRIIGAGKVPHGRGQAASDGAR